MHKLWCGKQCEDCTTSCALDRSIACSPDCIYLSEDGESCNNPDGACDFFKDNNEQTKGE